MRDCSGVTSNDLCYSSQVEDTLPADALYAAANQGREHRHCHDCQAKGQEEVRGFPAAWKHGGGRGEAIDVEIGAVCLPVQPDAAVEDPHRWHVQLRSIFCSRKISVRC